MADREKVIKKLESLRDVCNAKSNMAVGNGKVAWAGYANTADDAIALLKEQPKWHVFHKCELTEEEKQEYPTWKWIMRCDCIPNNGEQFLLYLKYNGETYLDYWDDDMWAEYACTNDGTALSDGDAWMEMPKPPEEAQG